MSLVQLIYVSSATKELSDDVLDQILESSVTHNGPQDVTGLLLYCGGNFMQVLEGEESEVSKTYDRISKDHRHHNLFILSKEKIEKKDFSAWSMGFRRVTTADTVTHPAYAPLFVNGFDAAKIGAVDGLALAVLKEFSKNQ
jgi:hypothetical protein